MENGGNWRRCRHRIVGKMEFGHQKGRWKLPLIESVIALSRRRGGFDDWDRHSRQPDAESLMTEREDSQLGGVLSSKSMVTIDERFE